MMQKGKNETAICENKQRKIMEKIGKLGDFENTIFYRKNLKIKIQKVKMLFIFPYFYNGNKFVLFRKCHYYFSEFFCFFLNNENAK